MPRNNESPHSPAFANEELWDGIIGGANLSPEQTRTDIPSKDYGAITEGDLDIARLLALHHQVFPQYQDTDLRAMDERKKDELLRELRKKLGIFPLRNDTTSPNLIPGEDLYPSRPLVPVSFPAQKVRDVIPLTARGEEAPPTSSRLGCHQCGVCCEMIGIHQSPSQLQRIEEDAWQMFSTTYNRPLGTQEEKDEFFEEVILPALVPPHLAKWRDMVLVPRMLGGRCLGILKLESHNRHVYGPCPYFQRESETRGLCQIYETQPHMCQIFPFDNRRFNAEDAFWKGCGFHLDPEHGYTKEEFQALLWPLEEDEQI